VSPESDDEEEERQRQRGNVAVAVAVAVLVVLGIVLMRWLLHYEQVSDCVAAGHRDCVPVEQPTNQ
jgi:hypothetical protein